MPVVQQIFGWLGVVQLFVLFAILVIRRHYQRMPVFTMSAGGVAVSNAIFGLHYTWATWMVHQIVSAALRFGVALELTYCIFGAFPAAAAAARRVYLAILVATAFAAMSMSTPDPTYTRVSAESIPRLAAGAAWILTALTGLVLWYRLPLGPLPKAILMGYAPYLLVFTIGMSLLFNGNLRLRSWVGYMDTVSFFILVNYWCRVAWRTVPEPIMFYAPAAQAPRQAS